jgi:hypothetical protein
MVALIALNISISQEMCTGRHRYYVVNTEMHQQQKNSIAAVKTTIRKPVYVIERHTLNCQQ